MERIDVRPPSPPLIPTDAPPALNPSPMIRISSTTTPTPKANPPSGLSESSGGRPRPRPVRPFPISDDAEDQLIAYKSDTRASPAWKTIRQRLNRDPAECAGPLLSRCFRLLQHVLQSRGPKTMTKLHRVKTPLAGIVLAASEPLSELRMHHIMCLHLFS